MWLARPTQQLEGPTGIEHAVALLQGRFGCVRSNLVSCALLHWVRSLVVAARPTSVHISSVGVIVHGSA